MDGEAVIVIIAMADAAIRCCLVGRRAWNCITADRVRRTVTHYFFVLTLSPFLGADSARRDGRRLSGELST